MAAKSRKTLRGGKQLREQRYTEQRNPASRNLDRMTARQIVRLMNREDRRVAAAVGRELPAIARAVDAIARALRNGGRLIYVGAGSSGRMGVLDAAECPPTFGTPPRLVRALIAGGRRAITRAVEGAEDSERNGEQDLRAANLTRKDAVVGIAASGTTPYVLGAMRLAHRRGAMTIAVTSNLRMPLGRLAKIVIAPEVGPEVLTGSTRLKAGTSQKMVLNMLTTAVMARLGHMYENLMIDMMLTNEKLADRALRILAEASGKSESAAKRALRAAGQNTRAEASGRSVSAGKHAPRAAGHNMRVALVMLKLGVEAKEAKRRLAGTGGDLRRALEK